MRKNVFIIFGVCMSFSVFALQSTKTPSRELVTQAMQEQSANFDDQTISANSFFVSNDGEFAVGKVEKHKLSAANFSATPIFVAGTDNYSVHWAKTNSEYLKKIHAMGLIADLHSKKQLECFEKETGLKAVPANIEEFSKIVGTMHYPFLVYQGWIIQ